MLRPYSRPVPIRSDPSVDIARMIDRHVGQPDLAEQLRYARGAPAFRAGGRGDGGERGLAGGGGHLLVVGEGGRTGNSVVRHEQGAGAGPTGLNVPPRSWGGGEGKA